MLCCYHVKKNIIRSHIMRKKPAAPHPVIWHCSSIRIFLIKKEIWKPIILAEKSWTEILVTSTEIALLTINVSSILSFLFINFMNHCIFNEIPLSWWDLVPANDYQCFQISCIGVWIKPSSGCVLCQTVFSATFLVILTLLSSLYTHQVLYFNYF